jgi:cephalosporin-C deacetylase
MPQFDLPEDELATYRSSVRPPADLDAFWRRTLDQSRKCGWAPKAELIDTGLTLVDTFDVTFSGFGGEPIKAWYRRPAGVAEDLPVVVRYQGYTGGRGLPHQVSFWTLAGFATLEVDSRGQGTGGGYVGDTADSGGTGPSYPGFMTRGVLDPEDYYYRRLFTDAVLAIDAVQGLPGVDPERVVVTGASQGGGIALAVAGMRTDLRAVMADVPFLSDFPRGMAVASAGPYLELTAYLATHRHDAGRVLETLAYFDASVLAGKAEAPALFSVALMDTVCPPSTVHAAYNAYGGPKAIRSYPYNDHEGGQFHHEVEQLRWLSEHVSPTRSARHSA